MTPRRTSFGCLPAAAVLLGAGCALAEGARQPAELAYQVKIDFESQRADVTATLTSPDTPAAPLRFAFGRGHTFLKLDEPLLEGAVVAADGKGRELAVTRADPFTFEVEPAAEGEVVVAYAVPMRYRELEAVRAAHDAYEFPYLDKDHGLLTTWTLFLAPEGIEPSRITVAFPQEPALAVLAPWPGARGANAAFAPPNLEALTHDLIAVGAWRTRTMTVGEFEAHIAIAPGQEALEASAPEIIERIVAAELALFGTEPAGRYLFLFGRPDIRGAGGSPKTSSMTLAVEPRLAAAAGRADFLCHLVAHEFFHTWAGALYNAPDELRWVNEGFTDYYAYLLPARLGITTWEEFGRTLGKMMDRCSESSLRGKLSLAAAGGEIFFRDREAYHLVYGGGLLAAAWLDLAIRASGGGRTLDDFMRAFNNDPRWEKGEAEPGLEDFFEAIGRFVDAEALGTARRLAAEPFDLDAVPLFSSIGLAVARETAEIDMDPRMNLDGNRALDLDPEGAAFLLGVRSGDRFVEVNGRKVSGSQEILAAWLAPEANRMRLVLERGPERLILERDLPLLVTRHAVAAGELAARFGVQ